MKKGQLFWFSSGSYSNYQCLGVFEALEDFDLVAEGEEYINRERRTEVRTRRVLEQIKINDAKGPFYRFRDTGKTEDYTWTEYDDNGSFVARLASKGLIKDVESPEVWLDDGFSFEALKRAQEKI